MSWRFFTNEGVEKITSAVTNEVSNQIGLISFFAGVSAPSNWLFCNGQQVLRSDYPDLDGAIGQTYGAYTDGNGNAGTTHLRVPDLRGRVAMGTYQGAGDGSTGTGVPSGTAITHAPVGSWHGAENVTLKASQSGQLGHSHTITGGSHTHASSTHDHQYKWLSNPYQSNSGNTINSSLAKNASGSNSATSTSVAGIGGSTVSGTSGIGLDTIRSSDAPSSHSNVQQASVVNYIILAR